MIIEALIIGMTVGAFTFAGFYLFASKLLKGKFIVLNNETSSGGMTFFGATDAMVKEALAHDERENIRREQTWAHQREMTR